MDEILIGEKKYVSSKRAAKVTGYAKDYVGQLCREGRVPARLVGRSWYVLESAIHDHRFGTQEIESENVVRWASSPTETIKESRIPMSTWESPRYEASQAEILPSVNRLRNESLEEEITPMEQATEEEKSEKVEEAKGKEDEYVNIPIHTVYDLPPEDLLPGRHTEEVVEPQLQNDVVVEEVQIRRGRGTLWAVQMAGALIAILIAATAVINTGYFDKFIISNSTVNLIAGVILYNK